MDETQWTLVDIIGPAVLVILLIWLVLRTRTGRRGAGGTETDTTARTEQATRENYVAEEQRRRDGVDGL